jgi:prefoldin beta subunit
MEENPLANLDKDTQEKIQEMQILEQNFQQLMSQKQAFSFEVNETDFALKELEKAKGDVFKLIGNQVIIKTEKEDLTKELQHKKELIDTRLKNIDEQEKEFSDKLNSLREEVMKKISPEEKENKE